MKNILKILRNFFKKKSLNIFKTLFILYHVKVYIKKLTKIVMYESFYIVKTMVTTMLKMF